MIFLAVVAVLGWLLAIGFLCLFLAEGERADELHREEMRRTLAQRARYRHPSSVTRIPVEDTP